MLTIYWKLTHTICIHIYKIFKPNLSCTGWTYSLRNLLRSALIGCSPFSIANLSASVGSGSGISNLRRKAKGEEKQKEKNLFIHNENTRRKTLWPSNLLSYHFHEKWITVKLPLRYGILQKTVLWLYKTKVLYSYFHKN